MTILICLADSDQGRELRKSLYPKRMVEAGRAMRYPDEKIQPHIVYSEESEAELRLRGYVPDYEDAPPAPVPFQEFPKWSDQGLIYYSADEEAMVPYMDHLAVDVMTEIHRRGGVFEQRPS